MTSHTLNTGTEHLLAEIESGVLTLTLNRPDALNAFSGEMLSALADQLADAETNPEVRCILLTGAGKGFCAGGDVKGMAAGGAGGSNLSIDEAIHQQRITQRGTSGRLFNMPKPTLAALPGAAAGAGMGLALACDLRIMSSNAILTTAFAKVGLSGDYGLTYMLPQLVGIAKARELLYFADRIEAEHALRLGLANWVCEPEALPAESREIARRLAAGPSVAFRYIKENLNRSLTNGDPGACMDGEAANLIRCRQTEDHRTAVKAFVARETPVFQGR